MRTVLVLCLVMLLCGGVRAQQDASANAATLSGLKTVSVAVRIDSAAQSLTDLKTEELQAAYETKLKAAGLMVVSYADVQKELQAGNYPGVVVLNITGFEVSLGKAKYANFSAVLEVRQAVSVLRDPSKRLLLATWQKSVLTTVVRKGKKSEQDEVLRTNLDALLSTLTQVCKPIE